MKTLTKLTLLAVVAAGLGPLVARADDPQLQNWLAEQRQRAEYNRRATTVAVYAGGQSFDQAAVVVRPEQEPRPVYINMGRGEVIEVPATVR